MRSTRTVDHTFIFQQLHHTQIAPLSRRLCLVEFEYPLFCPKLTYVWL